MEESILKSVKKLLGLEANYDVFDLDVMIAINSAFATLNQLGVGPYDGFAIVDDSSKWNEFTSDDKKINSVKSYVFIKARLQFDPPGTSYGIQALEKMALEYEWRLNVVTDTSGYIPPDVNEGIVYLLGPDEDFPVEAPIDAIGVNLVTGDFWKKVA